MWPQSGEQFSRAAQISQLVIVVAMDVVVVVSPSEDEVEGFQKHVDMDVE